MLAVPAATAGRFAGVALLLLALGISAPASALPTPLVVNAGWADFDWSGGLGSIDSPADGFQVTSATPIEIQVVDCCVIGDRYEILVNNVVHVLTSTIAPGDDGVPSGAFNGPDAWADARLSKVSFVLAAGTWDIDINVVDTALSFTSGNGFIQALVPEPHALLLLAVGLALLLLWKIAPRAHARARPSRPKR